MARNADASTGCVVSKTASAARRRRAARLRKAAPRARPTDELAPRKVPRQSRARSTRDAILTAAADLIATRGYSAVTTNHVAERAGVSIGSLYQYFPNKMAILVSLLEQHIADVQPIIQSALAALRDPQVPFSRAMHELFQKLIEIHEDRPRLNAALSEEAPYPPRIQRVRRQREEGYVAQIAEILRHRSDVRVGDAQVTARVIVVAAEALSHWLVHSASRSLDRSAYVREAVRLLTAYVSPT